MHNVNSRPLKQVSTTVLPVVSGYRGVRTSDMRPKGRGFDYWPFRCTQVTNMGKLLTHVSFCHRAVSIGTGHTAGCHGDGKVTVHIGVALRYSSLLNGPKERNICVPPICQGGGLAYW